MKDLKEHIYNSIIEGLKIGANTKVNTYKYRPKDKKELKELVEKLVKERGNNADLNDIDTSEITDMMNLFYMASWFNGDISKWDVSNVKNMRDMFTLSSFNGDISEWDVSNVKDMHSMFSFSDFSGDISKWDVSNVTDMYNIFFNSPLEKNPPKWYKKLRDAALYEKRNSEK